MIASLSTIKNFWKTKWVKDFYNKNIPKVGSNHTCLAVIDLDSAFKKGENYYLQVFLKESKYIEKKVVKDIHDILNDFSYFSFSDESDEE